MNNPDLRREAVVLLSGGIDSTACAHLLQSEGFTVTAAFIDHGQAAAKQESRAVAAITKYLGIPLRCMQVTGNEPFGSGELVGRNAFLVLSALFLLRGPNGLLAMGLHGGTPYYDCSANFVELLARLIAEQTNGRTSFVAPFVTWSKKDVFNYFKGAMLPIELTYSCEAGTSPPCGDCLSCRDRRSLGC